MGDSHNQHMTTDSVPRRRGRPLKFARPSQVVALTLPEDVISGLRQVHPDLARAIVTLFERRAGERADDPSSQPDAELVKVGGRESLIVVNRSVFKSLPGVNIIPLDGERAFLALEPDKGMADLELSVVDRLESHDADASEREALRALRASLREWRQEPTLRFLTRAIIVVERAESSGT